MKLKLRSDLRLPSKLLVSSNSEEEEEEEECEGSLIAE